MFEDLLCVLIALGSMLYTTPALTPVFLEIIEISPNDPDRGRAGSFHKRRYCWCEFHQPLQLRRERTRMLLLTDHLR